MLNLWKQKYNFKIGSQNMRPNNGINLVKISLLLGCHWGRNPFSTVNFLLPMYTVYRELWMHLILELDMGAPAQYWEILAQQKQVVLGEKRWDRVHCPVHHFRNQTSRTFLKNIEQERLKRKKIKIAAKNYFQLPRKLPTSSAARMEVSLRHNIPCS